MKSTYEKETAKLEKLNERLEKIMYFALGFLLATSIYALTGVLRPPCL